MIWPAVHCTGLGYVAGMADEVAGCAGMEGHDVRCFQVPCKYSVAFGILHTVSVTIPSPVVNGIVANNGAHARGDT